MGIATVYDFYFTHFKKELDDHTDPINVSTSKEGIPLFNKQNRRKYGLACLKKNRLMQFKDLCKNYQK